MIANRLTQEIINQLKETAHHRVILEGMILKPSMVMSGDGHPDQADIETVAKATIRALFIQERQSIQEIWSFWRNS